MDLEANNELLFLVDVEVVKLFKLIFENPDEADLDVDVLYYTSTNIQGCIMILKRDILKELLERLVAKELVSPVRKSVFQMDPELLPKFHRRLGFPTKWKSSFRWWIFGGRKKARERFPIVRRTTVELLKMQKPGIILHLFFFNFFPF